MFEDVLNPALNHKVICAIDFGTSGTGYSFAFAKPNEDLNPTGDIFQNATWPSTEGGKTSTSIVIQKTEQTDTNSGASNFNSGSKILAFGKKADEYVSKLRKSANVGNVFYFRNFKMKLYRDDVKMSDTNPYYLYDELKNERFPAVDVIGMCLSEVKKAFMSQISSMKVGQITDKNVLWALTVPAIWKDEAKKLMRQAAVVGGLISSFSSASLTLILEPEAASIWCLRSRYLLLSPNDVHVVADCGGGTIDVTVHRVTANDKSDVQEVFRASGGDWGSTVIDRDFFNLLETFLARTNLFTKLKNDVVAFFQLREEWEKRKCSYDGSGEASITLPRVITDDEEILDFATEFYNENHEGAEIIIEGSQLILSEQVMKHLFKNAIEETVNHVHEIVKTVRCVKSAVLVGNFANCVLLQRELRQRLDWTRISLIIPPAPGICVMCGAVLLANRPSQITQHIAKSAYGVSSFLRYNPSIHSISSVRYSNIAGKRHIPRVECMDWMVDYGDQIPFGKILQNTYYPFNVQDGMLFEIYRGSESGIVYHYDPRCSKLGKLSFTDLNFDDINSYGVELYFLFGHSELLVRAKEPTNGKRIDFLCKVYGVTLKKMFEDLLNPALNHKVICAIDFGTSGTGYAFAFTNPTGDLNPIGDVFLNTPWPLTEGGKTSTSIVIKQNHTPSGSSLNSSSFEQYEVIAFGKKADEKAIGLQLTQNSSENGKMFYFRNFKMNLYQAVEEDGNSSAPYKDYKNLTIKDDLWGEQSVLAVDVIALCLKEVKKAFMVQIYNVSGGQISEKNVLWAVTVPAIWTDNAKQLMRNAAVVGGLIKDMSSPSLTLILEPEAASIWCLKSNQVQFSPNDVHMLVDCGGGTIDVTVHRISSANKSDVQEVYPISGGNWGSRVIDEDFFEFLKELFKGTGIYEKLLQDSFGYLKLREEWEKRKISYDGVGETSISLPQVITNHEEILEFAVDFYNTQHEGTKIELEDYRLILCERTMTQIFSRSITKTVQHVADILEKSPNVHVDTILLVGNFANCPLLQHEFKLNFESDGNCQVVVPPCPGICVMNGAVLLANRPSQITQHISRFCYGTCVVSPYNPEIHESWRASYSSNFDGPAVMNCMDWFVKFGEEIPFGKTIVRRYRPYCEGQSIMTANVYRGSKGGIKYSADDCCQFLGSIKIDELDFKKIRSQGVEYHILFGASEIFIRAKEPDGKTKDVTFNLT
ncbi:hypothetical protein HK098_003754 [Nowakowskiella sp. JEL0407]|nr:hypothetical protein HK098_003754 [Nowakowskiella sp. JEL0407]